MKKKILVIGNYNDAIYHGLAGVDKRLDIHFIRLRAHLY